MSNWNNVSQLFVRSLVTWNIHRLQLNNIPPPWKLESRDVVLVEGGGLIFVMYVFMLDHLENEMLHLKGVSQIKIKNWSVKEFYILLQSYHYAKKRASQFLPVLYYHLVAFIPPTWQFFFSRAFIFSLAADFFFLFFFFFNHWIG